MSGTTARRSNQSILKEINPEYSLEELMSSNCGAGEDSLKVLWTTKVKPVNPKGNQPWIFIGMTYAEIETLILCPHDVGSWLIRKDPDAGKDLRQEKQTTEDEMVGWHHRWTQRTWVSAISRRWWRTGKPGVLQSMGSQRVRHDWASEQQQQIQSLKSVYKIQIT